MIKCYTTVMSFSSLVVTIMAAGEGKRMNSGGVPKVLCLFHGVPMLIHILGQVMELSPSKILIVTSPRNNTMIMDVVREKYNYDLEILEKIEFVIQTEQKGTAHAVSFTLNKYSDEDNVLILNGDMPAIRSQTLKQFLTASTSQASLLVAEIDNPFGYGRVITANYGEGDEIMYIREEKDCNEEERKVRLVNVGIYLFCGSVLKKYIPLIDCVNKQNEYYLTKIVKLINVHIDDKRENDIKITPFLIHPSKNHEILGVNTQEELVALEGGLSV